MLKPVLEGRLLQALALEPGEEVLEIGTGSGLRHRLPGAARARRHQHRHPAEFIATARTRLDQAGIGNVRLEVADALSWQPGRQFDAVAVTAAVAQVPAPSPTGCARRPHVHRARPLAGAGSRARDARGESLAPRKPVETDISYLRGAAPAPQFTF
jgi:protein-L-isoaspartate(D-aspartate) O-methyltransferase